MYLIASVTRQAFVSFLKMEAKEGWKFGRDIKGATRFPEKALADKMKGEVTAYLGCATNYVGDIKIVDEVEARKIAAQEMSEPMDLGKMHERWCPRYAVCQQEECRFLRDLKAFTK